MDGEETNVPNSQPKDRGRQALAHAARQSAAASQRATTAKDIKAKTRRDPMIGQLIAERYRVLGPIARGGSSRVYRGVQESIGRAVAIKVVRPDLGPELTARLEPRFRREAAAIGAMQHPNIVTILDFGREDDGTLYLVMEFVDGQTLRRMMNDGPIEPDRALNIFIQIARALRHAHDIGLVHRDIKPGNVVITQGEDGADFVKLLDFGLVKGKDDQALTRMGTTMGTPQYLSPEQARGENADGRSDIYSFGVVMYSALTGLHPFEAASSIAMALCHVRSPYPPMAQRAPDVPVDPGLEAIVRRCMEKRPDDRYPTANALLVDLKAARDGLAPNALREQTGTTPLPDNEESYSGAIPVPRIPQYPVPPSTLTPSGGQPTPPWPVERTYTGFSAPGARVRLRNILLGLAVAGTGFGLVGALWLGGVLGDLAPPPPDVGFHSASASDAPSNVPSPPVEPGQAEDGAKQGWRPAKAAGRRSSGRSESVANTGRAAAPPPPTAADEAGADAPATDASTEPAAGADSDTEAPPPVRIVRVEEVDPSESGSSTSPAPASLSGTWIGTAARYAAELSLTFHDDGTVHGLVTVATAGEPETRAVKGQYAIGPDGTGTMRLVEVDPNNERVWSATLHGTAASGELMVNGKSKGSFTIVKR